MVCGDIMSSCHNISPGKPRKFAMELTIDNIKSIFFPSGTSSAGGCMWRICKTKRLRCRMWGKSIDNIGYIRYNNYEINPIF